MPQHTTLRLVPSLQQITADAVAQYRRQQNLVAEREAIREIASNHGHFLGSWRVEEFPRTALIQCRACGEGARLDLDAACAHLTAGLTQPCQGLPSQHTRVTGEVI